MESEPANKTAVVAGRGAKLLQVIGAIALAVVSQLLLRADNTLLAVAGFATAAVLFIISVKDSLAPSVAAREEAAAVEERFTGAQGSSDEAAVRQVAVVTAEATMAAESPEPAQAGAGGQTEQVEAVIEAGQAGDVAAESAIEPPESITASTIEQIEQTEQGAETAGTEYAVTLETGRPASAAVDGVEELELRDKLRYLRTHWRLLTLAEVLRGDIPPSREGMPEFIPAAAVEQAAESTRDRREPSPSEKPPIVAEQPAREAPAASAARPPESSPISVKVTSWGDVLVLDTGREQLQRFDDEGSLLATYSLPGLAALKVLDMDVTPDYKTLYIVDASSRLQVFMLPDKDFIGDDVSKP